MHIRLVEQWGVDLALRVSDVSPIPSDSRLSLTFGPTVLDQKPRRHPLRIPKDFKPQASQLISDSFSGSTWCGFSAGRSEFTLARPAPNLNEGTSARQLQQERPSDYQT